MNFELSRLLMLVLVIEIRELDGERQSLVYNHHHELIEASDTIRKVSLLFLYFCNPARFLAFLLVQIIEFH